LGRQRRTGSCVPLRAPTLHRDYPPPSRPHQNRGKWGDSDRARESSKAQDAWWRTQLVSNLAPRENSLITGKSSGNGARFAVLWRILRQMGSQVQVVRREFPIRENREFFGTEQGKAEELVAKARRSRVRLCALPWPETAQLASRERPSGARSRRRLPLLRGVKRAHRFGRSPPTRFEILAATRQIGASLNGKARR
jgi:hypothetical protein